MASRVPVLANAFAAISADKRNRQARASHPSQPETPEFARRTFRAQVRGRSTARPAREFKAAKADVLLWTDTFTNYFQPGIAIAAYDVLSDAGFRVKVLTGRCVAAGPSMISACSPRQGSIWRTSWRRFLASCRQERLSLYRTELCERIQR